MFEFTRVKNIIKASVLGVLVNLLLTAVKGLAGYVTGSIVIINDALSSLNDMLAGIITIVGIFFASKQPDREHPYGYGQLEYVSTTTLAMLEVVAGATAFIKSIEEILHPTVSEYPNVLLGILALGIIIRLFSGRYLVTKAHSYSSEALLANGEEMFVNAFASVTTIITALAQVYYGYNLEGWFGLMIALFILKSSLTSLWDCLGDIVGKRVNETLAVPIKETIEAFPEVLGAYDLMLHRYGVEKAIGSVHIEVRDFLSAKEIHKLTRDITIEVFFKYGVLLTIGIYANNMEDPETRDVKTKLQEVCAALPEILELHGFYLDRIENTIFFDIVVDFSVKDAHTTQNLIISQMTEAFPQYKYYAIVDRDYGSIADKSKT